MANARITGKWTVTYLEVNCYVVINWTEKDDSVGQAKSLEVTKGQCWIILNFFHQNEKKI